MQVALSGVFYAPLADDSPGQIARTPNVREVFTAVHREDGVSDQSGQRSMLLKCRTVPVESAYPDHQSVLKTDIAALWWAFAAEGSAFVRQPFSIKTSCVEFPVERDSTCSLPRCGS